VLYIVVMVIEREGRKVVPQSESVPLFTFKQVEVLQCLVDGLDSEVEIAKRIGTRLSGVQNRKKDIVEKLEKRGIFPATLRNAIVLSIKDGLVNTEQLPNVLDVKLTRSEEDVFKSLATGQSNETIANDLSVGYGLKSCLLSMKKKFNVKSTNTLVAISAVTAFGNSQESGVLMST